MAKNSGTKRAPKEATRKSKKVCQFCKEKADWIDYKDVKLLGKFISDRGKIRARRVTGNCAQHQRAVSVAVKTSRELALLPYTQRTATERAPRAPRGERGERGGRDDRRSESQDRSQDEASTESAEKVETAEATEAAE